MTVYKRPEGMRGKIAEKVAQKKYSPTNRTGTRKRKKPKK